VLRRSPFATKPDAHYGLVWRGHFYDVWQQGAARRPCDERGRPVIVRLGGYPTGSHDQRTLFRVSRAGEYSVWVGGSFRKRLSVYVDGQLVASRRNQLNNAGQYTLLGETAFAAGTHVIDFRYSSSPLTPGSGGPEYGLGPLVITRATPAC
jgi:hypothetical protein